MGSLYRLQKGPCEAGHGDTSRQMITVEAGTRQLPWKSLAETGFGFCRAFSTLFNPLLLQFRLFLTIPLSSSASSPLPPINIDNGYCQCSRPQISPASALLSWPAASQTHPSQVLPQEKRTQEAFNDAFQGGSAQKQGNSLEI